MMRAVSRQTAILSIVDGEGKSYGLDMVKGSSIREVKESGARLAEFCGIPFEDNVTEASPLPRDDTRI